MNRIVVDLKTGEVNTVPLTPEEIAAIPPPSISEIVVSPRQLRQALTRAGLRNSVESAVDSGDQDLKDWWEFATEFRRTHPSVIGMASQLGVDSAALDSLFELAASL